MAKKNGNFKKTKTKKSNKKYKKYSKKIFWTTPSWYPFGKKRTCKLRYHEIITVDPSVGVAGSYTFSANGLWDPNISGTGNHQPYGYDQLMQLYGRYTVLGAKIRVTAVTTNAYYIMGVKLSDNVVLNTNVVMEIMEQPGFNKRIIGNNASAISPSVVNKFSAKKFFGRKGSILDDDTLGGTISANPADQAFFIVVLMPATSGQDVATATFQVTVDYIATFTAPRELPASY